MAASHTFKSTEDKVKFSLLSLTRSVNQLANEDLSFQRSAHPDVGSQLDDANERLAGLASELLKAATKNTALKAPRLDDADDIDLRWRGIVDVVDSLLEKADTSLDEYTGLVKRQESQAIETASRQKPRSGQRPGVLGSHLRNANIPKPQLQFERKPDNFESPWKPILTSKPHAKVPLKDSLELFTHQGKTTATRYRHPYEAEIQESKFPDFVCQKKTPIPYLPPETTAPTWVDTFDGVLEMLKELKQAKEIAIDLEHHDYRTYIGLTSLMQISTREQDWIVDTLKPWRHRLEVLNEVFTDPKILKVFHGSYMDMIWLQRDLGLYVVGLFDTSAACEVLTYPGRSLAYLLKRFVNFDADKKYQLADWRIRPIPEEMLYYARSDTHYLLYIYDHLRNALLEVSDLDNPEENRIEWVLQKSKEYSLQIYEGFDYGDDGKGPMGWFKPLLKHYPPHRYTDSQFAVYRAVHKWRDDLARNEDENPAYIMPAHAVYDISRHLPTDLKALISVLGNNSYGARPRIQELLSVIQQAAADPNPVSYKHTFYAEVTGVAAQPTPALQASKDDAVAGEIDRSVRSQMFGDIPMSSIWDERSARVTGRMQEVQISVPWVKFVEGVITEETLEAPMAAAPAPVAGSAPEIPSKSQVEEDVQFTLRTGLKRKSQAVDEEAESSEEDTSSSDPDSDSDSDMEPVLEKQSQEEDVKMTEAPAEEYFELPNSEPDVPKKKGKKKAGKNAKKPSAVAGNGPKAKGKKQKRKEDTRNKKAAAGKQDPTDYEPFDYTKAASVMRGGDRDKKQNGKEKKQNLFSKNLEGEIKGARAMNFEKSGRSQTFKK